MPKGKAKEYDSNHGCGVIVDSETGQQLTVYTNYINPNNAVQYNSRHEYRVQKNETRCLG